MSDTILTLTIPQLTCAKCSANAAVCPVMLKRGNGATAITDSLGNSWLQSGAVFPKGWAQLDGRDLCEACAEKYQEHVAAFTAPPAPPVEEPRRPGVGVSTHYVAQPVRGVGVNPIPSRPATIESHKIETHRAAIVPTSAPAPIVTNRAAPAAATLSNVRSVEAAPVQSAARVTGNMSAPAQRTKVVQNTPQIAADNALIKNRGGSALPNLNPAKVAPTPGAPIEQPRVRLSEGE